MKVKKGKYSLSKLERKINTNNETILAHCQELDLLEVEKLVKPKKNIRKGKPYTTIVLTDYDKK